MKITLPRLILVCLCLASMAGMEQAGEKESNTILIQIEGKGARAKYIKKGELKEKPVAVFVGQTVRWLNLGDKTHTATAREERRKGKPIFDTGDIKPKDWEEIHFCENIFKLAGGRAGGEVKLKYYCIPHEDLMESVIILRSKK